MNCTQCGVPLDKGARFCANCGAAVSVPRPEPKPEMDLSAFFDEPEAAVPAQTAARRPAREAEARPRNSDRGLNIALLILGVLAVAVLTFVLILLFAGKSKSSSGQDPQGTAVTVPSAEPAVIPNLPNPAETAQPVVPPGSVQPTTPVVVTPSPLPTTAPTPTPSPTPTPEPDYLLPESNSRYLTEADLSGLTHEQLCFARNEIFARHGRIFQTPEIAAYFNSKSWYHGTVSAANFSESVFNSYERTNIGFIRDYENKHYGGSYY